MDGLRVALVSLTLAASAGFAEEASPLTNANFDEGLKGWSQGLPGWTVETGAGLNGSRGLVFRKVGDEFPKMMVQQVTLKPGQRYHFGCWAKVKPLASGGAPIAQFGLEWHNAQGKWLGGGYVICRATGDEWKFVEQYTKEIPSEATKAHFVIFFEPRLNGSSEGDFAFDDFFIREASLQPLTAVTSSAYRNEVSETGKVTLLASTVRPPDVKPNDFDVRFAWRGSDGREHQCTATPTGAVAAVEVDVSTLAFGTNDVIVNAQARGKGIIGERRLPLARRKRPVYRRTYLDRFGRCVHEGKLFFPHGMYFSKVTDELLEAYTNSPFNVLMPYRRPTAAQLDSIARHGLMTFVSMQNDRCMGDRDGYLRLLEDRYGQFRQHPALFAWYVFDEAPMVEAPSRTQTYELVSAWDPEHPCWAVFCLESVIPDFLAAMDVIGVDPYPIGEGKKLTAVAEFCRAANRRTFRSKPMWNVPQAFDWGNYRPNQKEEHRMPTKEELRNMNWQHLACGANGLISYSFFDLQRQVAADWQSVREVAYEIDRYVPVILSEPGPRPNAPDSLIVRTWRKGDAIWVLAVNPSDEPCIGDVTLPGVCDQPIVELGDEAPTCDGTDRLRYRLGRYGVSLVRFTRVR